MKNMTQQTDSIEKLKIAIQGLDAIAKVSAELSPAQKIAKQTLDAIKKVENI